MCVAMQWRQNRCMLIKGYAGGKEQQWLKKIDGWMRRIKKHMRARAKKPRRMSAATLVTYGQTTWLHVVASFL